jgi:UDPglucose 6-dehydrogenase
MSDKLEIAIIGTGYVGLVSALCFCKLGHQVTAFDKDQKKINKLNQGQSTLFEQDIDQLLTDAIDASKISFSSDLSGLANKDVIFIAVGTPFDYQTSVTDLSQLNNALHDIFKYASENTLIINKSTAPIGTYAKIKAQIIEHHKILHLAVNPEFLAQGQAIDGFLNPDRVVVGTESEFAKIVLKRIYQPLIDNGIEYIETSPISGEIAKYTANNFLALKIAFINEIANLSEHLSADFHDIKKILISDKRIDSSFLNPGPGFGGSCFPKDSASFSRSYNDLNLSHNVIGAINISNKNTINHIIDRTCELVGTGKIISILGLTFKAGTDDVRSSQSIIIINELLRKGYKIKAYDPEAPHEIVHELVNGNIEITKSYHDAFKESNIGLILTEWPEFKDYDYEEIANLMQNPVIYDTRNLLDVKKLSDSKIMLYKRGN